MCVQFPRTRNRAELIFTQGKWVRQDARISSALSFLETHVQFWSLTAFLFFLYLREATGKELLFILHQGLGPLCESHEVRGCLPRVLLPTHPTPTCNYLRLHLHLSPWWACSEMPSFQSLFYFFRVYVLLFLCVPRHRCNLLLIHLIVGHWRFLWLQSHEGRVCLVIKHHSIPST